MGVPIILWFFLGAQALGHGHTLLTNVKGVDPQVRLKTSPSSQEYKVKVTKASNPKKKCAGTIFAMATKGKVTRMRIDGVEQLLDTSWAVDYQLEPGHRVESRFEFIDPLTQELLACRKTYVGCSRASHRINSMGSKLCQAVPGPAADLRRQGDPRLNLVAPFHLLPPRPNVYAAQVRLVVEILGEVNEEWWCPGVEVQWPDKTRSYQEGDCEPWIGSEAQKKLQSWVFTKWIGCGENKIQVRLMKGGETFATDYRRVRVACH